MPYKLEWYRENNVVFFEMLGELTAEEIQEACVEVRDYYLEVGEPPVHMIVDPRGVNKYPREMRVIHRATGIYANHENFGWMVLIGIDNRISVFIANVVLQALGREFRLVENLEEAITVLDRIEGTANV